jgi:hypothetical protein
VQHFEWGTIDIHRTMASNPLYSRVKTDHENDDDEQQSETHHSSSTWFTFTTKKQMHQTMRQNEERKLKAYEREKLENLSSVGRNTEKAGQKVFNHPISGAKEVLNARTGKYEELGSAATAPAMWQNIERNCSLLKFLAIIHNPRNFFAIARMETTEIVAAYGGTDDPKEIGQRILADMEEFIRSGGWSLGRYALINDTDDFIASLTTSLLLCNHPPTHPASPSSAAAGGRCWASDSSSRTSSWSCHPWPRSPSSTSSSSRSSP